MADRRDGPFVDDETFRRAVEPYSEMLRQLVAAGYRPRQEGGDFVPDVDSEAVAELSAQNRYAGEWDQTPIDTVHSQIGLLTTAGEDAMLAFADLVTADRTPIYAFVPVARSGIECFALAGWLAEEGIGVQERVRRSLNERIYSAWEQTRLPESLNPEPGRQARLLAAETLGFERTKSQKGRVTMFKPARPTTTSFVRRTFGEGDLGQVLYSYFSAITHGTHWGLASRASEIVETDPLRGMVAALSIGSDMIGMAAVGLAMAHNAAWNSFRQHMGWVADGWEEACLYARDIAQRHASAADRPGQP